MRLEIREDLELREDEWSTCLLHSFVNIVGVVQVRLALLSRRLPDPGEVVEIRGEVSAFRETLLAPGPLTRFEAGVPVRRHILDVDSTRRSKSSFSIDPHISRTSPRKAFSP